MSFLEIFDSQMREYWSGLPGVFVSGCAVQERLGCSDVYSVSLGVTTTETLPNVLRRNIRSVTQMALNHRTRNFVGVAALAITAKTSAEDLRRWQIHYEYVPTPDSEPARVPPIRGDLHAPSLSPKDRESAGKGKETKCQIKALVGEHDWRTVSTWNLSGVRTTDGSFFTRALVRAIKIFGNRDVWIAPKLDAAARYALIVSYPVRSILSVGKKIIDRMRAKAKRFVYNGRFVLGQPQHTNSVSDAIADGLDLLKTKVKKLLQSAPQMLGPSRPPPGFEHVQPGLRTPPPSLPKTEELNTLKAPVDKLSDYQGCYLQKDLRLAVEENWYLYFDTGLSPEEVVQNIKDEKPGWAHPDDELQVIPNDVLRERKDAYQCHVQATQHRRAECGAAIPPPPMELREPEAKQLAVAKQHETNKLLDIYKERMIGARKRPRVREIVTMGGVERIVDDEPPPGSDDLEALIRAKFEKLEDLVNVLGIEKKKRDTKQGSVVML